MQPFQPVWLQHRQVRTGKPWVQDVDDPEDLASDDDSIVAVWEDHDDWEELGVTVVQETLYSFVWRYREAPCYQSTPSSARSAQLALPWP